MSFQSALDNHAQVVDDCLVLTLPPGFDSTSYRELGDAVIANARGRTVKHLIVNLHPIDVVDSTLMSFLEEFLGVVRLLGCTTIVAGIPPAVAMAMTLLQFSFGAGVRTLQSVDEAVRLPRDEPNEPADDQHRWRAGMAQGRRVCYNGAPSAP